METRFVTYVGEKYKFFKPFEEITEQVIDQGVEGLYHQSFPRFRLWTNEPPRQVIFIQQSNYQEVRGKGDLIIPVQKIAKFFLEGVDDGVSKD